MTPRKPDITVAADPEFELIVIAGHEDKAHLKINKVVPLSIATLIMQLLNYASQVNRGLADPHDQPQLNFPAKPKIIKA